MQKGILKYLNQLVNYSEYSLLKQGQKLSKMLITFRVITIFQKYLIFTSYVTYFNKLILCLQLEIIR